MRVMSFILMIFLFGNLLMSMESNELVEKMSIETVLDKGENIVSISEGDAVVDQQTKKIVRKIGLWVTRIKPDIKTSEDRYNEEGKLDGHQIRYGIGGIVIRNLLYKNGILDGKALIYNQATGKISEEREYKNNVLDGEVIYYNIDGSVKETKRFLNGKEVPK